MVRPERIFRVVLASIALLVVLGQILGAFVFPDLWGTHFYRYLPSAWLFAALALYVSAFALLVRTPRDESNSVQVHTHSTTLRRLVSRPIPLLPLAIAAIAGCAFATFSSRQMILGDAWPLVTSLADGSSTHVREPLTMFLHHTIFQLLGGEAGQEGAVALARRAVALGSIASGVLFALAVYWIGYQLVGKRPRGNGVSAIAAPSANAAPSSAEAPPPSAPPSPKLHTTNATVPALFTLVLLLQGYSALFYGYVENYSWVTAGVAVYLATGLAYVRGRVPLVLPIVVYLIVLGLHLSAMALAPSLLFLVGWGLLRRRRTALRDLAIGAGAVVALDGILRASSDDFSLVAGLQQIWKATGSKPGGQSALAYLTSGQHAWDFANEQTLIGPFGALLLIPATVMGLFRRDLWDPILLFVTAAGVGSIGASWVVVEPALGYARDWDIFAASGAVAAIAALAWVVRCVPAQRQTRLLSFAALVSLGHVLPWILVNHSGERSLARMKELPLGLGRSETVVGNWYRRNGEDLLAIEWFERAIESNPNHPAAFALCGALHGKRGEGPEAVRKLRRALELRPESREVRINLVNALEMTNRRNELLPHYQWLCANQPGDLRYWIRWCKTLEETGQIGEARSVANRAIPRFVATHGNRPASAQRNIELGGLYFAAGRAPQSFEHMRAVLLADPNSTAALLGAGRALVQLGRDEEAVEVFRRLLMLDPEHEARERVLAWLGQLDESSDSQETQSAPRRPGN